MGQRHQIFLSVPNPRKHLRENGYNDEAMKLFHFNKRTVILPFHNQWLYGRRAPLSALRVLRHAALFSRFEMLGNPDNSNPINGSPFTETGIRYTQAFSTLEGYIKGIENLMNYEWTGEFNELEGTGKVSSSWFLLDEYKEMSNHFDMGDNNDGITIIDTINNKYCFMNISTWGNEDDERSYSASDLPVFTPVSAREYMKAYYPETPDELNSFQVNRDSTKELTAKENLTLNESIDKHFKNYKVLTLQEVNKLFPKMELLKNKSQTVK
jgi:hypothetical protein